MRLTNREKLALISAAEFLLAGEWDETITPMEAINLRAAADKLKGYSKEFIAKRRSAQLADCERAETSD